MMSPRSRLSMARYPSSAFVIATRPDFLATEPTTKHVNPGGDIFIHGLPPKYAFVGAAHRAHDWTLGCVAVTDAEIEEIWKLVPNGTPVEIKP